MTHSMLFISEQEKEQLVQIRIMTDKICSALDNLSPEVKEFIHSQIQVFKTQAEHFTDMLQGL
jgi:hypothetical protein